MTVYLIRSEELDGRLAIREAMAEIVSRSAVAIATVFRNKVLYTKTVPNIMTLSCTQPEL